MNEQRAALLSALELERTARGLSWRAVARQSGVTPGCLYRLIHDMPTNADAVFQLFAWLDALGPIKEPPDPRLLGVVDPYFMGGIGV